MLCTFALHRNNGNNNLLQGKQLGGWFEVAKIHQPQGKNMTCNRVKYRNVSDWFFLTIKLFLCSKTEFYTYILNLTLTLTVLVQVFQINAGKVQIQNTKGTTYIHTCIHVCMHEYTHIIEYEGCKRTEEGAMRAGFFIAGLIFRGFRDSKV